MFWSWINLALACLIVSGTHLWLYQRGGSDAIRASLRNNMCFGPLVYDLTLIVPILLGFLIPRAIVGLIFFFVLIGWIGLFLLWARRRSSGALVLLVRCYSEKEPRILMVLYSCWFLYALYWAMVSIARTPQYALYYFCWLNLIICGAFCWWLGLGARIELHERGIFCLGMLVPWSAIESYRWEGRNGTRLTMSCARQFPACEIFSVGIPLDKKVELEHVLTAHISTNKQTIEELAVAKSKTTEITLHHFTVGGIFIFVIWFLIAILNLVMLRKQVVVGATIGSFIATSIFLLIQIDKGKNWARDTWLLLFLVSLAFWPALLRSFFVKWAGDPPYYVALFEFMDPLCIGIFAPYFSIFLLTENVRKMFGRESTDLNLPVIFGVAGIFILGYGRELRSKLAFQFPSLVQYFPSGNWWKQ